MAQDESMCPHEGCQNPQHVHVPGKPHENGLKFYTVADMKKYLYSLVLHKRTEDDKGEKNDPILMTNGKNKTYHRGPLAPRRSVVYHVLRAVKPLQPDHHVFGDSYYGGIKVLRALKKRGHLPIVAAPTVQASYSETAWTRKDLPDLDPGMAPTAPSL